MKPTLDKTMFEEATFEEIYPRYPFAPLVAAAIALARRLKTDGRNRCAGGWTTPTSIGAAS